MDNRAVGERIRAIRMELGETLEEFGKRFNPPVIKSVISNWENHYNFPNKRRLERIAEIGNITVGELLGDGKDIELETLRKMKVEVQDIVDRYYAMNISGGTAMMLLRELSEKKTAHYRR